MKRLKSWKSKKNLQNNADESISLKFCKSWTTKTESRIKDFHSSAKNWMLTNLNHDPKLFSSLSLLPGSLHILITSFFFFFCLLTCMIFFTLYFRLARLALQNVNKDYVIFLYFCNIVTKNDKKRKREWSKHVWST